MEIDPEELSQEAILDIFYSAQGNLDEVNKIIDLKLENIRVRKISLFEKYIVSRLDLNPRILRMVKMDISPVEAAYLSRYPGLKSVEVLDLRQNFLGDDGVVALSQSPELGDLRELDLRGNQITRVGVKALAETKTFLKLEKLDLRGNQLGKLWEEKLPETGNFPVLTCVRTV